MKTDPAVIEHMNKVLGNELTAISQYFLHSRMWKDKGFMNLAGKVFAEALDEMKHADMLIERILYLEGQPDMDKQQPVRVGKGTEQMLRFDLELENVAIPDLRKAIAACEEVEDFATRDLLMQILNSEEEHVDWIETQLNLIEEVGIQNYLQSQIKPDQGEAV